MSDLKACPFCNAEVEYVQSINFFGVGCKRCSYNMPADKLVDGRMIIDKDHAISQHNTRANPWIEFDADDNSTWPACNQTVDITATFDDKLYRFTDVIFKTHGPLRARFYKDGESYYAHERDIWWQPIPESPGDNQC